MKRILLNLVPPSGGTRFPALDGLRGLAILGILISHISHPFPDLPPHLGGLGGPAVILLFVLSGFLLYLPITRRNSLPPLKGYYIRRLARIYPLYLIALAATIALIPLTWDFTTTELLANLFFIQTFVSTWNSAINPSLWFMPPLIHFYLIFPLLAWLCLRNRFVLPFLLTLALAAQGLRDFYPPHFPAHQNWPVLALPFFAGMLAAQITAHKRKNFSSLGPIGLSGLLVFALYLYPLSQFAGIAFYLLNARGPVISLCAFLAVMGFSYRSIPSRVLSIDPLRIVAMVGYGAYLFHHSARAILHRTFGDIPCIIFTIPLSIGVGLLTYLYIEVPIQRLARKSPPRQPQPSLYPVRSQEQA